MAIDRRKLRLELEGKIAGEREVRRKLKQFADQVADHARKIAPRDEGEFIASIKSRVRKGKDKLPSAEVYSRDPKAHLLEYGTGDDSPTPEYATFGQTAHHYGGTLGRDDE